MLFHACLLALSHSGRHENTIICTLLLCAGPIEGCSSVLAVRRYYVWLSELGLCFLVFRRRKAGSNTKALLFVFLGGHTASRADDTASFVSKKSTSPAVMFSSRLVLPSVLTWTERSACVANLPHLHKHTRARFLLLAVVMVLLLCCGWFWCCYNSCL